QVTPRAMVRSSRRLASPSTSSRTATLSPTMGKDPTSVEAQKLAIELDPLRTDPRPGVTLSLLTALTHQTDCELRLHQKARHGIGHLLRIRFDEQAGLAIP